ncbi:ATP-binding protein [Actinomadura oligospora]|uniref:ATP-binding protein n=1 Tax=Actinomadura oligospora TaxID=111804 RepID=UPI0004B4616C|nr:ATP-binding protein [Actinomadura oligospora]
MTSRHAHDDTCWRVESAAHAASSAPSAMPPAAPSGASAASVPEAADLPPNLDHALSDLVLPSVTAVTFTVLPDPESVTAARHFTLTRLTEWGLAPLGDDVGLVVSELVTNALRHSGGTSSWWTSPDGHRGDVHEFGDAADPLCSAPTAIRLRLLHRADWLLCGIFDASSDGPRRKEPDYIAETGRGLHLVESFSSRWGWSSLPFGKVVWALFKTT